MATTPATSMCREVLLAADVEMHITAGVADAMSRTTVSQITTVSDAHLHEIKHKVSIERQRWLPLALGNRRKPRTVYVTPQGVEEDMNLSKAMDIAAGSSDEGYFRSCSLAWLEDTKEEEADGQNDCRPKNAPDYLVLYTQVGELVGMRKAYPVEQPDGATDDSLHAIVNQCIEAEYRFVRTCREKFTIDDFLLSRDIMERAKQLLQSGCESSIATVAFLCITKEDELLCELFTCQDISKALAFANVIRQSASNLMLFKGSESDAATAAVAGIMEAEVALLAMHSGNEYAIVNYITAMDARMRVVKDLTKLEEELLGMALLQRKLRTRNNDLNLQVKTGEKSVDGYDSKETGTKVESVN
ncbi:hypothetical protein PR202_gb26807 [Eleusine coracana subsp. coracana]|uniref:Uncharacterized protein n=1 Tax=Eleusine coracana subsp. coracana TaxID=191504 RepID=A0AAV5FTE8_ELECO|nr:hypothetical protein PR202_gb26807 [Eleusine coracana subsp. coracana]